MNICTHTQRAPLIRYREETLYYVQLYYNTFKLTYVIVIVHVIPNFHRDIKPGYYPAHTKQAKELLSRVLLKTPEPL